jgi:hypothetical protein
VMNYRGTDNAAETDNDDVGFFWKLGHEYSPEDNRLARAKSVLILEMAHKRDAVAEASPNALKCDLRSRDFPANRTSQVIVADLYIAAGCYHL